MFDQYETDAYHFMQTQKFTVGGMRHLLRGAVAGLGHLHESGLAHLDVKPANILLRGTGTFRGYFGRGGVSTSSSSAATASTVPVEVLYQLPHSFEVVRGRAEVTRHGSWFLRPRFRTSRSKPGRPQPLITTRDLARTSRSSLPLRPQFART